MASVSVPLKRFEHAQLPATCAVSGVPAANMFAIKAGKAQLALPLHGDVARSIGRVQTACKAAFIAALGIFIVGLAVHSAFVAECASVPAVIGFGLLWAARQKVPSARIDNDVVNLDRVHEGFISALSTEPGKCSGCTSNSSCSIAEMDACESQPQPAS